MNMQMHVATKYVYLVLVQLYSNWALSYDCNFLQTFSFLVWVVYAPALVRLTG